VINEHLRSIRQFEAIAVARWLPPEGRLLEIGAGAGWQAEIFVKKGLRVFAIELPTSEYVVHSTFPMIRYDGRTIPFVDSTFDVVYSSNVLEHIPHVEAFQQEIVRVLKPNGRIIHALPTSTWRVTTSLAHYLDLAKEILRRIDGSNAQEAELSSPHHPGSLKRRLSWLRAVLPRRHGEFGNWLTEIYYFSRLRWERLFRDAGLVVEVSEPLRLFYTGYSIADARMSLAVRKRLSPWLGSAGRLFVLRRS